MRPSSCPFERSFVLPVAQDAVHEPIYVYPQIACRGTPVDHAEDATPPCSSPHLPTAHQRALGTGNHHSSRGFEELLQLQHGKQQDRIFVHILHLLKPSRILLFLPLLLPLSLASPSLPLSLSLWFLLSLPTHISIYPRGVLKSIAICRNCDYPLSSWRFDRTLDLNWTGAMHEVLLTMH
ncbi:hypothetical protein BX600DRAFT_472303 [Xylariales sp. PMI_506]|nr:hypothetical protein BX600DRAFT_472303 [Xylariales sp. PMI_506]